MLRKALCLNRLTCMLPSDETPSTTARPAQYPSLLGSPLATHETDWRSSQLHSACSTARHSLRLYGQRPRLASRQISFEWLSHQLNCSLHPVIRLDCHWSVRYHRSYSGGLPWRFWRREIFESSLVRSCQSFPFLAIHCWAGRAVAVGRHFAEL